MGSATPPRHLLLASYEDACERETALWEQVAHRSPGRAGHDPVLWQRWLDALSTAAEAGDALGSTLAAAGAENASQRLHAGLASGPGWGPEGFTQRFRA